MASSRLPVDWVLLSASGPAVVYHVGCIIKNKFYIHGGLVDKAVQEPTSEFFVLDLNTSTWTEIIEPGSPALSHHASIVLQDRYLLLIGGWDGKVRTSDIYAFDTEQQTWMEIKSSGYPKEAGLSSHTAVLLKNSEILIIGREGSLHMQRRHNDSYILRGSIEKGSFHYSGHNQSMDSRSGHTANLTGLALYVIGGRSDRLLEIHGGFAGKSSISETMASRFKSLVKDKNPLAKQPGGRRYHIAVAGHGVVFIHGGETFDGRRKEPVGEMYLLTTKLLLQFFRLGESEIARAGHVCCSVDDRIIIHGGFGGESTVHRESYELKILDKDS